MKKLLFSLVLAFIVCQIHAVNVYCTPAGTGGMSGTSFSNAFSPYLLMYNLATNPSLSGDVNIIFSRGHYYDDFHFLSTNIQTTITSISLYGGFHESIGTITDSLDFINRNFYADETVFHGQIDPVIKYHCSWLTSSTNIIDGITIVSDNSMSVAAMELYNGDHLISHCRIKEYKTTSPLLWLENGYSYKCILNSVIENNEAECLLSAYCDLDIINSTIADNNFMDCLIYENLNLQRYAIYNSIIWNCKNYDIAHLNKAVHVGNSIIEYYDSSWMGDDGNNFWNTDPQFTYIYADPHTCLSTSVALNNGYDGYLTSLPSNFNVCYSVAFYEMNLHPRFFEDITYAPAPWNVDIGAYQNFYDYQNSYYNIKRGVAPGSKQSQKEQCMPVSLARKVFNILGQPVDETYHGIVIQNGQKVLQ